MTKKGKRVMPTRHETDELVYKIIYQFCLEKGYTPIIDEIMIEIDNGGYNEDWPDTKRGKTSTLRVASAMNRLNKKGMIHIPDDGRSRRIPGRYTVKGLKITEVDGVV